MKTRSECTAKDEKDTQSSSIHVPKAKKKILMSKEKSKGKSTRDISWIHQSIVPSRTLASSRTAQVITLSS
jgi:hypothetical protein